MRLTDRTVNSPKRRRQRHANGDHGPANPLKHGGEHVLRPEQRSVFEEQTTRVVIVLGRHDTPYKAGTSTADFDECLLARFQLCLVFAWLLSFSGIFKEHSASRNSREPPAFFCPRQLPRALGALTSPTIAGPRINGSRSPSSHQTRKPVSYRCPAFNCSHSRNHCPGFLKYYPVKCTKRQSLSTTVLYRLTSTVLYRIKNSAELPKHDVSSVAHMPHQLVLSGGDF